MTMKLAADDQRQAQQSIGERIPDHDVLRSTDFVGRACQAGKDDAAAAGSAVMRTTIRAAIGASEHGDGDSHGKRGNQARGSTPAEAATKIGSGENSNSAMARVDCVITPTESRAAVKPANTPSQYLLHSVSFHSLSCFSSS